METATINNNKICIKCNIEKDINKFRPSSRKCKTCQNKLDSENNGTKRNKKFYNNHKKQIIEYNLTYYYNNKEKLCQKSLNNYYKKKALKQINETLLTV